MVAIAPTHPDASRLCSAHTSRRDWRNSRETKPQLHREGQVQCLSNARKAERCMESSQLAGRPHPPTHPAQLRYGVCSRMGEL